MSQGLVNLTYDDFKSGAVGILNNLLGNEEFADVVLVAEEKQIKAHKFILSSCSPFFSKLFKQNPHPIPLVYLKGVSYENLQNVLSFVYKGETTVSQEKLQSFLEVGEELSINSLTSASKDLYVLGKRGAAKKSEKQMKCLDDIHEEEEGSDDEDNGRRGWRNKKNPDKNKENARVNRARNLDHSSDLNIVVLEDLVKGLLKHKDGWPFERPITKADAHDYHLCVRNPMDLGTIRGKLNDMQYTSNQEVINDIRLVFSNCYSYNMVDAEEYGCAERLEKYFDSRLKVHGLVDEEATKPRAKKRKCRVTVPSSLIFC